MKDAQIELIQGDITLQEVDAIVNAANSSLLGGGGVDGAIHRAAGRELLEACRTLRTSRLADGLPTGQAVITNGYRLPARFVIHAVGPVMGRDDLELLGQCYRNCLNLAEEHACASLAFPAISTGVYRVPMSVSAHIARQELLAFSARHLRRVVLVLFAAADLAIYRREFGR